MIAASLSATKSGSSPGTSPGPLTPSTEAIAKQLGIDTASEQYLMHVVEELRIAPLPPTWTAIQTSIATITTTAATASTIRSGATQSPRSGGVDLDLSASSTPTEAPKREMPIREMASTEIPSAEIPAIEYVNRFTGARTSRHPGTPYFLAAVESERKRQGCAFPPEGSRVFSAGSLRSTRHDHEHDHEHGHEHEHEHTGSVSSMCSKSMNDIMEGSADWDTHSTSDAQTHRTTAEDKTAEHGNPKGGVGSPARKRVAMKRGKRCRWATAAVPKWLTFTSWWHETTSGTENTMNRKHASIRYCTATDTLEVELQDVPAIFEVSHATGRHGKVGTIDLHVGAQICILGRQMRLMQCDGVTGQWLESSVRSISKAKAAFIKALEREGDGHCVRVRCRSDRLEASASAQRGGGSVGSYASIDRRSLMQDVVVLRDTLAETKPDEARRLAEGLL